jgi:hypothetical protein
METDMAAEVKPDRKMWFSMWFLEAIASFGLAFFPFFYYSVSRRNQHFRRQAEFERKVAGFHNKDWEPAQMPKRNAKLWAASIILIIPVFALAFVLSKDLNEHERRQYDFLATFYPERKYATQYIAIRNCALVTLATLGFGVIYWLYKIVNLYNNHFKEQYHIEHELTQLMESQSRVQPV